MTGASMPAAACVAPARRPPASSTSVRSAALSRAPAGGEADHAGADTTTS